MIREIKENDFDGLLQLYMQLHDNPFPEKNDKVVVVWNSIVNDKNHHIIVADENGILVSSCVCVIVPNLTHGQRPYALVENVITEKEGLCNSLSEFCKGNCSTRKLLQDDAANRFKK